ncbi:MAG: type I restriction enzyme HsdR N-terminal domain-containing protein [Bacteroidales bacterium]|nr:type I restriction enzyme HsdR N-terminal domain-containing protein [Bacteroidales bacterium]MBK9358675.1 type I restriction enzyme HsdR N-terminal domain-containing protein [Bacteroidales bacterium]
MQALNFPEYDFRTRVKSGQIQIFDPVRKKYVSLTPEEWVRQHLIRYLVVEKHVPLHMMACERGLLVNRMPKRFDLVVFGLNGNPVMIAECKAPGVKLSEATYYQIGRYNLTLKVKHLLVSNGLQHYFGMIDYHTGRLDYSEQIFDYQQLCEE